jgi:SAM-dependent methyltransferase
VLELRAVPVFCNVLEESSEAARAVARGDVELVVCRTCGMLANAAFDPAVVTYRPGYENSLHHSPTFQRWARGLAARIVDGHGAAGGRAVEIGCGSGGFLELLCEAGIGEALGFDPSFDGDVERPHAGGTVRISGTLLDDDAALDADVVVCRHVLEHLPAPGHVVALLARNARPGGVVYVEVPDAGTMLRDDGLYDVIYEHCGYFTEPALRRLLAGCGLAVSVARSEFGGQYLCVEASTVDDPAPSAPVADADVAAIVELSARFSQRSAAAVDRWRSCLADRAAAGHDVVVWGAGSKGVTFLNVADPVSAISRAVDINPAKHGRFVPGAGQVVVAPASLRSDPPAAVVVMNRQYRDEVASMLDDLGVRAEVLVA